MSCGDYGHSRQLILIILFVFCTTKVSSETFGSTSFSDFKVSAMQTEFRTHNEIVDESLKALRNANPVNDALDSIVKKDYRFIGVGGYSISIPGVINSRESFYIESYGVRIIEGTESDIVMSEKDKELNKIAWDYAVEYNRVLEKYLNGRGGHIGLTPK